MPFPNFINIGDPGDLSLGGSVNLLLASIAFEEFALANLINAEAEKIQYILGTLEGQTSPSSAPTLEEILEVNHSADQTLRDIIKKEILLQLKLENVLEVSSDSTVTTAVSSVSCPTTTTTTTTSSTSTSTTTTSAPSVESAWVTGIDFGTGCAQYTTLELGELCKAVRLNLACQRVPVGTFRMVRCGTDLVVTISVVEPYVMDQVYLYVGVVAPTDSTPENFPFRYVVTDSADYFTAHTFTVDVSGFLGRTLYVSAYARVIS